MKSLTRMNFVQAAFATACAVSVFSYVFTHIDEIKAKQEAATRVAMDNQKNDIQRAQEGQKAAIEAAQAKQKEAIEKIKNGQR
mgnify:CR=1 FL=1